MEKICKIFITSNNCLNPFEPRQQQNNKAHVYLRTESNTHIYDYDVCEMGMEKGSQASTYRQCLLKLTTKQTIWHFNDWQAQGFSVKMKRQQIIMVNKMQCTTATTKTIGASVVKKRRQQLWQLVENVTKFTKVVLNS